MVAIFKEALTAEAIKAKARALGADLVGIADGAALEQHPPDPNNPQRPSDITAHDGARVIVLAKRLSRGVARIAAWNDRHKYYNDELALTRLEEASLELVYWLEDNGYPAIIVPPTHSNPWTYQDGKPTRHLSTLLSLPHAAVEAGLGTLGLNLQLLTPEYGPRVVLTAVLCSVDVACDTRPEQTLCLGPSCARCLKVCPGDAVGHWSRDWEACDPHRSPHGFAQLSDHVTRIIAAPTPEAQKELVRSEDSFNLWQSILRGAGVITGCRKCADVCPVGADYQAMLSDALDAIPDSTPAKENRAARMEQDENAGRMGDAYVAQQRWIGQVKQRV
jgi:epoxyqueuosine reductase